MRRLLNTVVGLRHRAGFTPAVAAIAAAMLVALVVVNVTRSEPGSLRPVALPTTSATPEPTETVAPEPTDEATQAPRDEGKDDGGANLPPLQLTTPPGGSGTWGYANGTGPLLGTKGSVLTYRVAVEDGLPISVAAFTAMVDDDLGDPRGWTGNGERRFRRVSGSSTSSFTVYLASPWTAYRLCMPLVNILIGGVPYTSCQNGPRVVINADRYFGGSKGRFTGSLDVYRHYVINHEVGHRLGKSHEHCPGTGKLAPVMQQQTLRMEGCKPNPWPYPNNPAPTTPPPTTPSPTTPPPTSPPPTTTMPPTTEP
ncbi:MAG TPA: DUF3152 domain-containing protein [Micromonosporaceae bacterium]